MNQFRYLLRTGIVALALCVGSTSLASATTLGFDDLGNFVDLGSVSPYHGFNFTFFTSATSPAVGNFGNGVVSPSNEIFSGGQFNGAGGVTDITGTIAAASGNFTLNSINMTYGWRPGLNVVVTGFNGATPTNATILTLSSAPAALFSFNWTGLTSVTFRGVAGSGTDPFACGTFNCTQFTLDNFVVNNAVSTVVPEPASMMLLGAGLAVVGARRWRRTQK